MKKAVSGFTIVELLIVVVVIAILAVMTVVAFNGVQNRANDSVVQNDLRALAKKMRLYHIDNSAYPSTFPALESMQYKASGGAYAITPTVSRNHIYCIATGLNDYALLAKSKSGNAYILQNDGAILPFATAWGAATTAGSLCDSIDGAGTLYTTANAAGYWTGQTPNWGAWTGV
ncbi:MAG TPA: prepilin-type N-terminal cleavage/methylation domain-containing protein [Candidatus Saccharibacteria bacterium]|nr:prepilin-type N-terminal cleavage/methylation domain-containing protein [Candidatus Saccharibacteria bacterium]HRK94289.1 prepilin-type N-terminal cleavage/methylation domain-containing protein [Candidatus Saccharibacteria bacterium]